MQNRILRRTTSVLAAVATACAVLAAAAGSPAFGQTAGFDDVPGDAYFTAPVADLSASGVFDGTLCDEGFCPGEPMDRATMAVWTVRVLDGQDPPRVSESRFDDVDADSFYAPFIERMFQLEVTQGCGDGSRFCPDRIVTRAEMAVFLSRAYDLADGPDPGFADVPSEAWFAMDVARLTASGITKGCGDGTNFCPSQDTTRGQMATFLHRAENRGETEEPTPTFKINPAMEGGGIIAASGPAVCGIRTDQTLTCWGYPSNQWDVPSGKFTAVTAVTAGGWDGWCGIRTDQTLTCWGDFSYNDPSTNQTMWEAPSGKFTAVTISGNHGCGIRTDQTLTCWGDLSRYDPSTGQSAQWEAPSGKFTAVTISRNHGCGIRTDQTLTCWGDRSYYDSSTEQLAQWEAPSGKFTAVTTSRNHGCGIRTDQTLTCWGDRSYYDSSTEPWGQWEAPSGKFTAVTTSERHDCGIRTDQTLACWGELLSARDEWDDPSGKFTAVIATEMQDPPDEWPWTCGIKVDQTVTCWGLWEGVPGPAWMDRFGPPTDRFGPG